MNKFNCVEDIEKSKLFQRMRQAPADATNRAALEAGVRAVAKQSSWISSQICRVLPQYTLHNDRHLLNVLAIMEELLEPATLEKLSALECGLCILAAFTHDLGMALSDEEHRRLTGQEDTPEKRAFLRHRDEHFAEDCRLIEHLRRKKTEEARKKADVMEGHILADYLRRTHSSDTNRVNSWLDKIKEETGNTKLFYYGNLNFQNRLAWIAISHNQEAHWLREQLTRNEKPDHFRRLVERESVNFALPGLLLRLSDIMDFDASRTPGILFHHFGIDDLISVKEWQKHMAITGWGFEGNGEIRLRYDAADCPHPVIHKTILKFCGDMELESRQTNDELLFQKRLLAGNGVLDLRIPKRVEANVSPAEDSQGRKAYLFHDLQFRLDQDEILQLLMGETLYGDPTLAIRELLQNALDALQMRDLRLRLLKKHPKAEVEPTDYLAEGAELSVRLTWGKDDKTGQEFIRVADNGSGMRKGVLEKFFTQIGKSYYRSPDFFREQALLRSNGLLATPISQFGIGILSCFMIGERLEVRTNPGCADKPDREAYDVTVSGPGSLFWLRPGTLENQGTEVTVYLKSRFQLSIEEWWEIPKRLRNYFEYVSSVFKWDMSHKRQEKEGWKQGFDPALIAAQHVIWPMYTIRIGSPDREWRLDDKYHFHELNEINTQKVRDKAKEGDCPSKWLGDPKWHFCDWVDEEDRENATGSRIRLVFARHFESNCAGPCNPPSGTELCSQHEIDAFVEASLSNEGRFRTLIKGMAVSNLDVIKQLIPISHGVGTYIWIDLRGTAAPRLTADRQKAMRRNDIDDWEKVVFGVFERWQQFVQNQIQTDRARHSHWVRQILWLKQLRPLSQTPVQKIFHLLPSIRSSWRINNAAITESQILLFLGCLDQELFIVKDRAGARARDLVLDLGFVYNISLNRDLDRIRESALPSKFGSALTLARSLALGGVRDRALDCALNIIGGFDWLTLNDLTRANNLFRLLPLFVSVSFLAEAFNPDLERSFPALGMNGYRGSVGNGLLLAPLTIQFNLDKDERTVLEADPEGKELDSAELKDYDLVFPITNIPMGSLRRNCPEWRTKRDIRPLGILPFLMVGNEDFFNKHALAFKDLLNVSSLQILMPRFELWGKPFAEWSPEDWRACGLTARWDIEAGTILWAEGAHSASEMEKIGKPIHQCLNRPV